MQFLPPLASDGGKKMASGVKKVRTNKCTVALCSHYGGQDAT